MWIGNKNRNIWELCGAATIYDGDTAAKRLKKPRGDARLCELRRGKVLGGKGAVGLGKMPAGVV